MATHSAARLSLLVVSALLMTTAQAWLQLDVIKNNVQPKSPVAEIGSSFTFNCTVNQSSFTADDVIWKHYSKRVSPEWQRVVNPTLVQLVIPNITESSKGNYECRSRRTDQYIGGERLEVGYPPDQPRFERCQSDNLVAFTCWWNRGRDPLIRTDYNLTYTFKDGIGEVYNCPEMGENYCRWTYTDSGGKSPVYGVLHYMTLTATNALGSASVLHEVDPENQVKPAIVQNVRTSNVGESELTVSWQYPDGLDDSYFDLSFQVRYWSEWDQSYKERNASMETFLELRDLNPYTEYTICVRSHPLAKDYSAEPPTLVFKGYWSDCASNITVRTQPAAPSGQVEAWLLVTKESTDQRTVKVLWKPLPPWDRHSEGVDYVVTYEPRSEGGSIVQSERRTFVFNNQTTDSGETLPSALFQDERTYEILISANNSIGRTSDTQMTVPKYQDTPTAPTDLSSEVIDDGTIQLSWQPVSATRSDPTRSNGYIVFWREWVEVLSLYQWVEKGWAHVDGSQRTFDVRGLSVTKPTRFKFGVLAKTAGGFGTPVYVDNYTRIAVPQGSVEDVEVNPAGPNSLTVTWKPHALQWRNGLLQGYRIRYCQVASCDDANQCSDIGEVNALGEDTISHQLGGLQPFTSYRVQVQAFNTEGSSDLSDPACIQTEESAPLDAPTNLTFVIMEPNVVTLDWIPPATPNGVITRYVAEINSTQNPTDPEIKGLGVNMPVNMPVHGVTSYNISVKACTVECGPLSEPISFKTPIGAPGPPRTGPIKIGTSGDSSIVLKLSAPSPVDTNGPIHHYIVFYQPQNSTAMALNTTVSAQKDPLEVTVDVGNCEGPVTYNFWVRAVNIDTNGKMLPGEKSDVLEQEMCGGAIPGGTSVTVTIIVIVAALVVTLLFVGFLFKTNKDRLKKKLFPHVPGPALPYYDEMIDPYDSTYSQLNFPTINYSYNNEKEQVDNIADFLNKGFERVHLVQNDANMNSTMPISDTVDKVDKKPLEDNAPDDRRSSGYSTSTDPADPSDNSQPKGLDPKSQESAGSIAPYTKLGENGENPGHGQPSVSPEGIELAEMGAASAGDPPAQDNPIQDVADYLKTADGIMDYVRMGAGGDYYRKSGTETPDYLQTYTLRHDSANPAQQKAKPMDGYVRAAVGKPGQFVEPDYKSRYSLESLPVTSGSSGYKSNESQPSTTAEEPPSPESQLKNYISKSMPNILQGFPFAPATVAGATIPTPIKEIPSHQADNTTYIKTAGEMKC
ncbi:protein sidekick homolog isoform X4 [Branchiostoma floridae x Branchiostoma belcheri]